MRYIDLLKLSWRQLKERRLRTILTILAISVGVIAIVSLSSHVEGMRNTLMKSLEKLGPSTIIVVPRRGWGFTEADVVRLKSAPNVADVIPALNIPIKVPGFEESLHIVGISISDLAKLLGEIRLTDGSPYMDVPAPQAIIGYEVAFDTSTGEQIYRVGQPIILRLGPRPIMLLVVGILDSYGTSAIIKPDESIFVPVNYIKMVTRRSTYNILIIKARSSDVVDNVGSFLVRAYGGRARVVAIKHIARTISNVASQVNMLLISIASISLITAAMGTFNIMMVSVLERIREIGILKALGMRNRSILLLYLNQALLLATIGSAVGVVLGIAFSYILSLTPLMGLRIAPVPRRFIEVTYEPRISPQYIALAVVLAHIVTIVASIYPSWRASKLEPVIALRHE